MAQINKFERHEELSSSILKNKTFLLSMLKKFGLGIEDFYIEEIVSDEKETLQKSKIKLLNVVHKNENEDKFNLSFFQESDGTQNIMYLLNNFIPILETGGIIIIDEIENSIHPYLIKNIINMISDKSINKFNVQLIFSTHMPYLLDDRTKTQIYIVEKNNELSTELYRLDSVEGVRNDDNFCNKYLAGAYGGVCSDQRWF